MQGEIRLKSFLPSGSGEMSVGWTHSWVWDRLLGGVYGGICWLFLIVLFSDRDAHRFDGRILCGKVRTER